MSVAERVLFSWSGGKDSTLALYDLLKEDRYTVHTLLTTVSREFDRICMHGVRKTLLDQQAEALGIPSHPLYLTADPSNREYETQMEKVLKQYHAQGIRRVVFGDIFLEDLKRYRDERLARVGMEGIYPLWKRDSRELVTRFIGLGFKAVVSCADTQALDASFAGRIIDDAFLKDLPSSVDPCGENGEFHSFVFDGPLFKKKIPIELGERVIKDQRFAYCDLVGKESE